MPENYDAPDEVSRRSMLKSTAVGALFVTAGGQLTIETAEARPEADITFGDQESDGSTILIESATLPDGGFISIQDPTLPHHHIEEQHEVDWFETAVLGASEYLEEGSHENIEIELDSPLERSYQYQVMVHRNTNGDETFDYVESRGNEDRGYFFLANNPVARDAGVTLTDEPSLSFGADVSEVVEGAVEIRVTGTNPSGAEESAELEVIFGDQSRTETATVGAGESATQMFTFDIDELEAPGEEVQWAVTVDGEEVVSGTVDIELEQEPTEEDESDDEE